MAGPVHLSPNYMAISPGVSVPRFMPAVMNLLGDQPDSPYRGDDAAIPAFNTCQRRRGKPLSTGE